MHGKENTIIYEDDVPGKILSGVGVLWKLVLVD